MTNQLIAYRLPIDYSLMSLISYVWTVALKWIVFGLFGVKRIFNAGFEVTDAAVSYIFNTTFLTLTLNMAFTEVKQKDMYYQSIHKLYSQMYFQSIHKLTSWQVWRI